MPNYDAFARKSDDATSCLWNITTRERNLDGMSRVVCSRTSAPSRLRRCRRGATTVEFAVVSLPFIVVVIGIMEMAWQYTTASLLDAAMLRASRFGAIGTAAPSTPPAGLPNTVTCRSQFIPWFISNTTNGFLRPTNLVVQARAFGNVSIVVNAPPPNLPNGQPPPSNFGIGEQIVRYDVTYRQPFLVPGWRRIVNLPPEITHRAVLLVKNEPFENVTC